jgi:hypothetical protein
MKTQLDNDAGNNNDMARELAERLADAEAAKDKLEAANNALKEEIERKNKTVEGFMAENEALKAELGGKPLTASANDRNTGGGQDRAESESLNDLVAQARRLGW